MSAGFAAGEAQWRAHLGTMRQVVRQGVVARQLAGCLPALLALPPLPGSPHMSGLSGIAAGHYERSWKLSLTVV